MVRIAVRTGNVVEVRPVVHYGTSASRNEVIKCASQQDQLVPSLPNMVDMCAMARCVVTELIPVFDMSVWRVRDHVRGLEKERSIDKTSIQRSEVLEVSVQSLEDLCRYQGEMHDSCRSKLTRNYRTQAAELMRFHVQAVQNLKLRSDANNKRLQNEITLAFNTVASAETTVVRSITILTMFFLPATHICASFSTVFFSFSAQGWAVSDKIWLYWAITIPATASVGMGYWIFTRGKIRDVHSIEKTHPFYIASDQ